ncbi:hypothetical protein Bca52824_024593 [Brassica carinata]|uniref:Anthranilate phosphoribosyltransferase n=1 Tax=Brassica carinata TaxID=52824 RepID=A0A8X7VKM9_BRACI|nr:hypothetical protein Bca52824_024593 [Brassica carinata]
MDSPGKSLKVKTPVQAPINKKLEKEGEEEDGFNTPKGAQFKIPPPVGCPPAPVPKNIQLGMAALRGEKGAAYDRIVLNAGTVDNLLGCDGAEDVDVAMERAKGAIYSGKALKKLLNYIEISRKIK